MLETVLCFGRVPVPSTGWGLMYLVSEPAHLLNCQSKASLVYWANMPVYFIIRCYLGAYVLSLRTEYLYRVSAEYSARWSVGAYNLLYVLSRHRY